MTASDEIGESIFLFEQFTVFVPLFAEVATTAYLCYGNDETSIDETVIRGTEIYIGADAIAAVRIYECRSRAVAFEPFFINDSHRYFDTIGSGSPQAMYLVVVGVEARRYFLLFELGTAAVCQVIFV